MPDPVCDQRGEGEVVHPRLTNITQSNGPVQFGYDGNNRRALLTLPNGVTITFGYDQESPLTGLTYKLESSTLGNLAYAYDALNRRTQVGGSFAQTNLPPPVTSAAYDAANQLTQ